MALMTIETFGRSFPISMLMKLHLSNLRIRKTSLRTLAGSVADTATIGVDLRRKERIIPSSPYFFRKPLPQCDRT
jgi:hypothetical protein